MLLRGEDKMLAENSVPLPLSPTQLPYVGAWDPVRRMFVVEQEALGEMCI